MSIERKEIISCPSCGKKSKFTMWDSLNADLDPEAKQKLINGSLLIFRCKHCGDMREVFYPILYHDMTHRVMIQLVGKDSVDKTIKMLDDIAEEYGLSRPGYQDRIVTSHIKLREKAALFDKGVDDRIAEAIKILALHSIDKRAFDIYDYETFLWIENDTCTIDYWGDDSFSLQMPFSAFESISKELTYPLDNEFYRDYIIDADWAIRYLGNSSLLF